MNILELGDNQLPPLDYSSLLGEILSVLSKEKNPFKFSDDRKRLQIDVDRIAFAVAMARVENPLALKSGVKMATVNFSSTTAFADRIRQIRDRLGQLLRDAAGDGNVSEAIAGLLTDLSTFKCSSPALAFTYPFEKKYTDLQKHRLSIQSDSRGSESLLKFHKLTITVGGINSFGEQLQESLSHYIESQFADLDEYELEDLNETLTDSIEDKKSDLYELRRIMDTESLGKLKREAKIRYLEFILANIDSNEKDRVYLQDLIRRLQLLEDYINDSDQDDEYYRVSYEGTFVNLRDLFARAEVFDSLPIIPLIAGDLGETTDEERGERQLTFGMKLKFGGEVHIEEGSPTVLDYHLNQIASNSPKKMQEHMSRLQDTTTGSFFKERVLRIAFLYSFILGSNLDPNAANYDPPSELSYDPRPVCDWIREVLRTEDENSKRQLFNQIREDLARKNVKVKIDKLKDLLQKFLKRDRIWEKQSVPLQIGVKRGILERSQDIIIEEKRFFKLVWDRNGKNALKYIAVEEGHVDSSYLCHLPVTIAFEDLRYFRTDDRQTFSMGYDIVEGQTLPVMMTPALEEPSCRKTYDINFEQYNLIFVPYKHERLQNEIFSGGESHKAFLYGVTFSLLLYICLWWLLELVEPEIFVPIMRLHLGSAQDSSQAEVLMRSLSKLLSHLLSDKHQSNAQGLKVGDPRTERYRVTNALSSMYSVLPKVFQFSDYQPRLEKLAIIVVSSKESDASWRGDRKLSTLVGEAIGIEKLGNGSIRLEPLYSFCTNDEHQRMFQRPVAIENAVAKLYDKGFRHFLYIAKTPYSSTLNLTQKDEDDSLFFMSRPVMQALKEGRNDIKIYPVFYDKYYVVAPKKTQMSMYVQDTRDLTNLVADSSKQVVVFYNLFNGIKVGKEDDRFYNGVISYATLLGDFYEGVLDDQDINMGLIYDSNGNSLKTDILQYLTLFHFSRYEKSGKISLKLDPYENIIGDDGVGALSIVPHSTQKVEFNLLAFLTEARRALNVGR